MLPDTGLSHFILIDTSLLLTLHMHSKCFIPSHQHSAIDCCRYLFNHPCTPIRVSKRESFTNSACQLYR